VGSFGTHCFTRIDYTPRHKKPPSISETRFTFTSIWVLLPHHRPELIPVHNDSPLVAVILDLPRRHRKSAAYLYFLGVKVSQFCRDNRAFIQLYQCHSVRGGVLKPGRCVSDGCEREDLAAAAEGGQTSFCGKIFQSQCGQTSRARALFERFPLDKRDIIEHKS